MILANSFNVFTFFVSYFASRVLVSILTNIKSRPTITY